MILLLLACSSPAPTGIPITTRRDATVDGSIVDNATPCVVEVAEYLDDASTCCPEGSTLLGESYDEVVCMVTGYTASFVVMTPAEDGLVDRAGQCQVPDRIETNLVDYSACCPAGTEFITVNRSGAVCGVRG